MIAMICVSIANNNVKDMIENAKKAIKLGANFLEFRLDYLQDISPNTLSELKPLSQQSIPIVFTCRKASEGAHFKIDEPTRLKIIENLVSLHPDFVDLEININKNKLSQLISLFHKHDIKIILSYHNFKNTPPLNKLDPIISSMFSLKPEVIKIVLMANNKFDNLTAFNILEKYSTNYYEIISFCMGSKGTISRLLCPFLGSKFTFASLDNPTAPGQISISQMKKIYKILIPLITT